MRIDVRGILLRQLAWTLPHPVAVACSAGVDSLSVLFALKELGHGRVSVRSFTMAGHDSNDYLVARDQAARLGFHFLGVELLTDPADMVDHVRAVCAEGGPPKKTTVECTWPWYHLIRSVSSGSVLTGGWGADCHFGVSRKAQVHYRGRLDEFRAEAFGALEAPGGQTDLLTRWCSARAITFWAPFCAQEMKDAFRGTAWNEVNRPRQKEPIPAAFPEQFSHVKVRPHVNLQLGDSGIAEHWASLLSIPELNVLGRRAPAALYRDIAAGRAGSIPAGNVSRGP